MDNPTSEWMQENLEGKRASVTTDGNLVYHGEVLRVSKGAVIMVVGHRDSTPRAIPIKNITKAYPFVNSGAAK